MSASFDTLNIPYSHPTPDDLARCFVATGVPASLAAAGSAYTDAAVVVNRLSLVTGADGTKGVILPAGDAVSETRIVYNSSGSNLKVYPDAGGTINGGSTDASVTVAAKVCSVFIKIAALTWLRIS